MKIGMMLHTVHIQPRRFHQHFWYRELAELYLRNKRAFRSIII